MVWNGGRTHEYPCAHWCTPPCPLSRQCEAEFLSDGRVLVRTKLVGRYTVQVSFRVIGVSPHALGKHTSWECRGGRRLSRVRVAGGLGDSASTRHREYRRAASTLGSRCRLVTLLDEKSSRRKFLAVGTSVLTQVRIRRSRVPVYGDPWLSLSSPCLAYRIFRIISWRKAPTDCATAN